MTILSRQNEEQNIQRIAAQRFLYSKAKRYYLVRLIVTIPAILLLSITVAILKSKTIAGSIGINPHDLSWLLASFSILAFVVDRLLEQVQQRQTKCAAAIQEEFDCDVLQLQWNEIELPKRPSCESILLNAKNYLKKHGTSKLRGWYTCHEEDGIPLVACRIICQRSNVSYDCRLRESYIKMLLVCGSIGAIIAFSAALCYDLSLRVFISASISPILPIIGFVYSEVARNHSTVKTLEEISDRIEKIWRLCLSCKTSDVELTEYSRRLQDRIYHNRKDSALIPDKLYNLLRKSNEELMMTTAEQMERQYKTK